MANTCPQKHRHEELNKPPKRTRVSCRNSPLSDTKEIDNLGGLEDHVEPKIKSKRVPSGLNQSAKRDKICPISDSAAPGQTRTPQKQAQEVPNDVQETPNGDQKRANGKVRKAEKSSSGWKKPFPDIPATGRNSGVGQVSQKRVKKTLKDAQEAPTADQEEQSRTKSRTKCRQSQQG